MIVGCGCDRKRVQVRLLVPLVAFIDDVYDAAGGGTYALGGSSVITRAKAKSAGHHRREVVASPNSNVPLVCCPGPLGYV